MPITATREWLAPLDSEGCTGSFTEAGRRVIGSNRGFYAGMNIVPKAGYTYQWESKDPRALFLARQRGWEVVKDNDEDGPAYRLGMYNEESTDTPTPLDTSDVYGDLILMRMTEHRHQRIRDEILVQNAARMEDTSDAYLSGASPQERATGRTGSGYLPTRLARAEHGVFTTEGGSVVSTVRPKTLVRET